MVCAENQSCCVTILPSQLMSVFGGQQGLGFHLRTAHLQHCRGRSLGEISFYLLFFHILLFQTIRLPHLALNLLTKLSYLKLISVRFKKYGKVGAGQWFDITPLISRLNSRTTSSKFTHKAFVLFLK